MKQVIYLRLLSSHGRIVAAFQGWDILIEDVMLYIIERENSQVILGDADEVAESLRPRALVPIELTRQLGGYAFTHSGRLRRQSGETFSSDDALRVLEDLDFALHFLTGRQTAALLPIGRNAARSEVWWEWRARAVENYRPIRTWAILATDNTSETLDATGLSNILNSINRAHRNGQGDVLRRAISWYTASLGAQDGGAALVLGQAGLELLAWRSLVGSASMSVNGFERLSAADKLSLLLANEGIGAQIPERLKALRSWASSMGRSSGPEAVAEVRNKTVHATGIPGALSTVSDVNGASRSARRASITRAVSHEARLLTTWYLELILLRWLGYHGAVHSRITDGFELI